MNNLYGCLGLIIIFSIVYFIIKFGIFVLNEFGWLILGAIFIIVFCHYAKLFYNLLYIKKQNLTDSNYQAPMGEVYKVCPFCNAQVKVTEVICPKCKNPLN